MRRMTVIRALLAGMALLLVAPAGGRAWAGGDDYAELCRWLTGLFSSEKQARDDPQMFDIRLTMTRIWPERDDGYWLYVEQARADAVDAPYRQRVYQVVDLGSGEFESRVYTLPGADIQETIRRFAGAGKDPSKLADVTPADLKLREGCSIYLKRDADGCFSGSTRGRGCPSSREGASYVTSEVRLSSDVLESWDRGWDESGKQVWGSVQGGYVFRRVD